MRFDHQEKVEAEKKAKEESRQRKLAEKEEAKKKKAEVRTCLCVL